MTEVAWLASTDPRRTLEFVVERELRGFRNWLGANVPYFSPKKRSYRRLYMVACAIRRQQLDLPGASRSELIDPTQLAYQTFVMRDEHCADNPEIKWAFFQPHRLLSAVIESEWAEGLGGPGFRATYCPLFRDIFGNPFRPAAIDPAWLAWNNGTVVKLAKTIYEDRRWELMPILGDALEDALCGNAEILEHCRGPGPHVRGCWVVDLILGKE